MVFYNPFRNKWVFSLRYNSGGRKRRYWETIDLINGLWQGTDQVLPCIMGDSDDPRRYGAPQHYPQLYNMDAVAYESLFIGFFAISEDYPPESEKRPKINEILLGYSRDGFYWSRPDRSAFLGVSNKKGAWNFGNVQGTCGGCLIVEDKLFFYTSGRQGGHSKNGSGRCTTGLAFLRRDGFASMEAETKEGFITTRLIKFKGRHVFVNVNNPGGALQVETLGEKQPGDSSFHERELQYCSRG